MDTKTSGPSAPDSMIPHNSREEVNVASAALKIKDAKVKEDVVEPMIPHKSRKEME